MKITFLVIISFLVLGKIKAENQVIEVDAVLDRCCELGIQQSSSSQKCSATTCNIPDMIKQAQHTLCRSNIEFCCLKNRQKMNCDAGKRSARPYTNCNDRSQSEMFQICCNACKVGQQVARAGGKCKQPVWGSMSDHARHDCCFLNYDFKEEADENISVEDEDLEEAADYMTSCEDHDCSHRCETRNGSATCICGSGFYLASDGRTCVTNVADPIRRDDCKAGFRSNYSGGCEDIDECLQETHTCHESEICLNTLGSFTCELGDDCGKGFSFNTGTMKCEDINECQSEKPCLLTEDCINTEGSYHCKTKFCNFGFELNHITGFCDDIDECESKQPHCGWNKHCVNTVGSFKCECNRGLRGDFYDQNFCVDVDECATPGTCHHSCQNSYGSFRCFCSHGFKLNSDNKTCSDVDECAVGGSHFCEKICKNTIGSYRCECPKGFKLFHRGLCNDVNECDQNLINCNKRTEYCLNTHGSAKCMPNICQKGYRMNKQKGFCVLMDRTLCFDNSNEISGSCQVPERYDQVFIAMMANATLPTAGRGFFELAVTSTKKFEFEFSGLKTLSIRTDAKRADLSFFRAERSEKSFKNITIKILKPIESPQEIEVDLWIKFSGKTFIEDGIVGVKFYIVVS